MTDSLLVTTNKARIWVGPDRTITKEFFEASRARGEYRNLRLLRDTFPLKVSDDGWCYRTVDIHGYKEPPGSIRMEHVQGSTLSRAMAERPALAFHLGRWLGYFHQCTLGDTGEVTLFSDVSVHNFIVDEPGRTVTAIDPGLEFGGRGTGEVDVIMGVASLLSQSVRRRTRPRLSVLPYLEGYRATGCRPDFQGRQFVSAIRAVLQRFETKRRSRLDHAIFSHAISMYSRWTVPRLNQELDRRGSGRTGD